MEVPRFARWLARRLCWIWYRNLGLCGPGRLPSLWKTHRCPARRCSTPTRASGVKMNHIMQWAWKRHPIPAYPFNPIHCAQWALSWNTCIVSIVCSFILHTTNYNKLLDHNSLLSAKDTEEEEQVTGAERWYLCVFLEVVLLIQVLTSGLNGGSVSPASSILKLISLKKGCDCTSFPSEFWQPNLSFGSLVSSYIPGEKTFLKGGLVFFLFYLAWTQDAVVGELTIEHRCFTSMLNLSV